MRNTIISLTYSILCYSDLPLSGFDFESQDTSCIFITQVPQPAAKAVQYRKKSLWLTRSVKRKSLWLTSRSIQKKITLPHTSKQRLDKWKEPARRLSSIPKLATKFSKHFHNHSVQKSATDLEACSVMAVGNGSSDIRYLRACAMVGRCHLSGCEHQSPTNITRCTSSLSNCPSRH